MNKKRIIISLFCIVVGILLNAFIWTYEMPVRNHKMVLELNVQSSIENTFEVFYSSEEENGIPIFSQGKSTKCVYNMVGSNQNLVFKVSADSKYIRLDFGSDTAKTFVNSITISCGNYSELISLEDYSEIMSENDSIYSIEDEKLLVNTTNEDPYIIWDIEDWNKDEVVQNGCNQGDLIYKVIYSILVVSLVILVLIFYNRIMILPKDIWENRKLIWQLSKNDFKTRFAGSYLGIIWAFIQPIVTVMVYWFVFEKGLKAGGVRTTGGLAVPYVLWLIAGIVPWFFFSEAFSAGTNSLIEYSYLVKKVVFKIDILPTVKLISALFVHVFFLGFALVLFCLYGLFPGWYILQIVYYSVALFALVLGLAYATCSLVLFFRDLTQIIGIILQIGMWITPIMWNIDAIGLNEKLQLVFKANPLYYIVSGYRDSLINKVGFWEKPGMTLYYWGITLLFFVIGTRLFKKLKIHFADVL